MGCFYLLMILTFRSSHHFVVIICSDFHYLKLDGFTKFQIEKVSGLQDDENSQAFIVQKFRALFGFQAESPTLNDEDESFSPSPCPSPSPSPSEEAKSPSLAPAPSLPIVRPRSSSHRPQLLPKPHKVKNAGNKGSLKRILVGILVSAVVVSILLLVCYSTKLGKHRSKVLFYKRRGKSNYNASQNQQLS